MSPSQAIAHQRCPLAKHPGQPPHGARRHGVAIEHGPCPSAALVRKSKLMIPWTATCASHAMPCARILSASPPRALSRVDVPAQRPVTPRRAAPRVIFPDSLWHLETIATRPALRLLIASGVCARRVAVWMASGVCARQEEAQWIASGIRARQPALMFNVVHARRARAQPRQRMTAVHDV